MPGSTEPTVVLSPLHRADGSATFSQNGYSVIGSVNGPIEVTRRDELPEEAAVEVIVRPASGVGGTRERHLESILQATLRQILLVHNFPRTLIQITLQIISTPYSGSTGTKLVQATSNLPILPALLQTAVLASLSASIPLSLSMNSVLLVYNSNATFHKVIENATSEEIQSASSVHVLGFTSRGDLLLAESEGAFTLEEWDEVYEAGKKVCCGYDSTLGQKTPEDGFDNGDSTLQTFVKSALLGKVQSDLHWKF